ncbi:response regulator transcription factor [bacterium]|nr:response regulator transcription factor [bacterium]
MKILIVEDEVKVASFLKKGLTEQNYAVEIALDGEEGLLLAQSGNYDLLIVDWMVPKLSGLELCQKLRETNFEKPILMLTAKDRTEDKIKGLDAGADDYLTKPFSFEELLARTRALIRRGKTVTNFTLECKDLKMDLMTHKVTKAGKQIPFSGREFALFEYFLRNQDKILTRKMIAENVWELNFDTGTNTIDVYISYLRSKIQNKDEEDFIKTIRGVGYIFSSKG